MLFVRLIYVLANYGAAPVALPLFPAFAKKKGEGGSEVEGGGTASDDDGQ